MRLWSLAKTVFIIEACVLYEVHAETQDTILLLIVPCQVWAEVEETAEGGVSNTMDCKCRMS